MAVENDQPDRYLFAKTGDNSIELTFSESIPFAIAAQGEEILMDLQGNFIVAITGQIQENLDEIIGTNLGEYGLDFIPSVLDGGQSWFSFPVEISGGSAWDFDRNPDQYRNFGGQIALTIDTLIQADVQTVLLHPPGTPEQYGITVYRMGFSTTDPSQDIYYDQ